MWTLIMLLMGIAAILSATLTADLVPVTPDPVLVVQAVNTELVDFTSSPVAVVFGKQCLSVPSNFQTAPDTFTIPKTGIYRISSNITVTETSGIATQVIYGAQVNSIQNLVLGLDSIRDNGILSISGDVVAALNAGDKVQMVINQIFGTSTGIGYNGITVTSPTESYILTNVSFQYIKE
jgi:hypothetical protein